MEDHRQNKGRLSVPAFGEWDMKNGVPDYSLDFSKIREKRLQNRSSGGASYGNEDELLRLRGGDAKKDVNGSGIASNNRRRAAPMEGDDDHRRPINDDHRRSPTGKKRFINYFQCCIGA